MAQIKCWEVFTGRCAMYWVRIHTHEYTSILCGAEVKVEVEECGLGWHFMVAPLCKQSLQIVDVRVSSFSHVVLVKDAHILAWQGIFKTN